MGRARLRRAAEHRAVFPVKVLIAGAGPVALALPVAKASHRRIAEEVAVRRQVVLLAHALARGAARTCDNGRKKKKKI